MSAKSVLRTDIQKLKGFLTKAFSDRLVRLLSCSGETTAKN